jgi:hypothetical protein
VPRVLLLVALLLLGCESGTDKPSGSPGGIPCETVAAKVRASYTDAQREMFTREPKMRQWFDTTMRVLQESCEQDRWPEPVKQCALDAKPGDPTALQTCNQTMPADLQQRMQARMTQAMKLQP